MVIDPRSVTMKNINVGFAGLLMVMLCLLLAMPQQAAAQAARPGVIEDIQPIENRGEDESKHTETGRKWGRKLGELGGMLAGRAVIMSDAGNSAAGRVAGQAVGVSGGNIGSTVGARVAGEGETTRYMVKVRLDSGRVLSMTQLAAQIQGMQVGDRIMMEGRGDAARILPAQ
jgi:hypothetical protein